MCFRGLIVKSCCCCGAELGSGVFAWAVADALFHLALVGLPAQVAEIAPFATYFMAWIGFLVFVDVVLAFACKAQLPAFMTLWMIVFGMNVCLCVLLWFLLPVLFAIHDGNENDDPEKFDPMKRGMDEVWEHGWWSFLAVVCIVILALMPFVHAYFWVTVKSLRRRLLMEIAVDFDPGRHHVTHTELTVWDWLYGGRGGNGRPEAPMPTEDKYQTTTRF